MWIISMNALVRALDTNYPQAPFQDRLEGTEDILLFVLRQ
jgi:hypothetical protein